MAVHCIEHLIIILSASSPGKLVYIRQSVIGL